jgi:hypothetical protein
MKWVFASVALIATCCSTATAAPLFSDNFGASGADVFNWNGAPNWTVSSGSVDLIGAGGGFDLIPGNGRYVDLDGSTNQAGLFQTVMSFGSGTYLVQFSLGGSHRGSTEQVTVSLGNWSESFTLNNNDGFIPIARTITTTGGTLRFQNANGDGSPNVGALLDNVSVSVAIPEPATLAVFGGIALAGAFGFRRRKAAGVA